MKKITLILLFLISSIIVQAQVSPQATSPEIQEPEVDSERYYWHTMGNSLPSFTGSKLGTKNAYPLYVITNDIARITIDTVGNVGIGTTNPTKALEVNGTIRSKEIVVEIANWSDYVFAKEYELLPLNEVESYIKENGHLPDVPSAEEVKKHGIEVGEMNAILLQKIEELTLYVIELEKKIAELEK